MVPRHRGLGSPVLFGILQDISGALKPPLQTRREGAASPGAGAAGPKVTSKKDRLGRGWLAMVAFLLIFFAFSVFVLLVLKSSSNSKTPEMKEREMQEQQEQKVVKIL